MRIGFGYDVHQFEKDRPLILGGTSIPYTLGLKGHSDADVLIHALMDSMLGALALGDIGSHFPDTDNQYKGIASIILLDKVCKLIEDKGYEMGNCDITVVAQAPKLAAYIQQMQKTLAQHLRTSPDNVSIKATTEEGLGFTGRKEGISAYAVCLLIRSSNK